MQRHNSILILGATVAVSLTADSRADDDVAGNLMLLNDNGAWSWYEDERAIVDPNTGNVLVGSIANASGSGGRNGSVEIASFNLATRRVLKISRHPISLDRPVGESEDSYFGDFIEDEKADNPVESATQEMLKDKIEQVLKTLTYREREIIKLRYGIGDGYTYTLEEVGRIFKVTRERVRQVEAKAIRKLQHPVRARKLEGFLPGSIPQA